MDRCRPSQHHSPSATHTQCGEQAHPRKHYLHMHHHHQQIHHHRDLHHNGYMCRACWVVLGAGEEEAEEMGSAMLAVAAAAAGGAADGEGPRGSDEEEEDAEEEGVDISRVSMSLAAFQQELTKVRAHTCMGRLLASG